jgi:TadE-like protein
MGRSSQLGQAAVETAITLPLALFLVLGSLQLFMLLQGRLFAEHAAYSAVRVGVVRHGDCAAMTDAAILALLPNFNTFLGEGTPGASPAAKMANAFQMRTRGRPSENAFEPSLDDGHDRSIVWLYREQPRAGAVTAASEHDFDLPGRGYRLELRVVYWFPMRIPFANWLIATMYRAYFGLGDYTHVNPLMPTQTARWSTEGGKLGALSGEFITRYDKGQYAFPVTASYAMHMMTPPRVALFRRQNCDPAP